MKIVYYLNLWLFLWSTDDQNTLRLLGLVSSTLLRLLQTTSHVMSNKNKLSNFILGSL